MRDPVVIGLATAFAALVLVPAVLWFLAAAFVTGTGCLWVMGFGGCVPWVPTPTTI